VLFIIVSKFDKWAILVAASGEQLRGEPLSDHRHGHIAFDELE
jgi:hypothetical protein